MKCQECGCYSPDRSSVYGQCSRVRRAVHRWSGPRYEHCEDKAPARDAALRTYHCRVCGRHVSLADCFRDPHTHLPRCPTPKCEGSLLDFILIRKMSGCPICSNCCGGDEGESVDRSGVKQT